MPNKATLQIREFATSVLEDPTYRANVLKLARRGKLHPSVEVQLYHYAYGVPKVPFEVEGARAMVPCFLMPSDAKIAIE